MKQEDLIYTGDCGQKVISKKMSPKLSCDTWVEDKPDGKDCESKGKGKCWEHDAFKVNTEILP